MNEEHTEYLVKTFPNLYKEYNLPMTDTCMCWGFDCGDGWFELVNELSEKLEPLGVVASQVKEKFGGLRFYLSDPGHDEDEAYSLIDQAEEESYSTCQECGEPGSPNDDGNWIETLCHGCRVAE